MKRSKLLILLFYIFVSLLVSGCNGSHETDNVAYVVAIGIDKAENNKLVVTYQIANPREIAGGSDGNEDSSGGSQGEKKSYVNIALEGFTVSETRNELKSITALIPVFYHTKLIIFGEELARSGIGDVLGPLMRFQEYRGSIYVATTGGTAQEFLEKNSPAISISTAEYYELMLHSYVASGLFPGVSLHYFYNNVKSDGRDAYTTFINLNPRAKEKHVAMQMSEKSKPEQLETPKIAGEINRIGGDEAEFLGTALFHGDKMAGVINSHQTRILNIFSHQLTNGFVSVKDPLVTTETKGISFSYKATENPKITTQIIDGHPVAHIHLRLEGEISSIASGINYENAVYQKQLEDYVSDIFSRDLMELIHSTQAMDCDVLALGDYFRPSFSTLASYKNFQWKKLYKDADISGEVEFTIRRDGLMWQTKPIQE